VSAPFSVSPDGLLFAAADGPELLTWRNDGAPQWKVFTDGILVGVAVGLEVVVTVDTDRRVCQWRRTDGELVSTVSIAHHPLALVPSPDGRLLIVTRDGPLVDSPLGFRLVPVRGCTWAALGPGEALGVGCEDGTFTAIELRSGAAWGSVKLPAPVSGVAWSALGSWLVGAERTLYRVSGDGKLVQATIAGADHAMDLLAVSGNGIVVAARAGDRVELYELHKNRSIGEFILRRAIGGVQFGPGLLLAIGLDDGDGNWIEMATGATFRTEPHPGRSGRDPRGHRVAPGGGRADRAVRPEAHRRRGRWRRGLPGGLRVGADGVVHVHADLQRPAGVDVRAEDVRPVAVPAPPVTPRAVPTGRTNPRPRGPAHVRTRRHCG
jgi:hypothetical protein